MLLLTSNRRIVDNGSGVVFLAVDMPVDSVVAHVQLAAYEPEIDAILDTFNGNCTATIW